MSLSPLLHSLEQHDRGNRTGRKLLVGPTLLWGREALRALARHTGGWAGWESVTLRSLADELSFVALSDAGIRPASDIEIGTLVGNAMDQAIADRAVGPRWRELAGHAGFRRAIRDGVLELRSAGIGAAAGVPELTAVLQGYAALLTGQHLTDPAGIFDAALAAFDTEAPFVLDAEIFVAPGLGTRGLPGRLLQQLLRRGARVLGWSAPAGHEPPPGVVEAHSAPQAPRSFADPGRGELDLFVAATPADEVREALRRTLAEGCRLDEIELATTDPDTYGTALDALARRLGFTATLQEGLPPQRSRIGRAISRHLDWMEQGLPADLLREALEAGDVLPPGHDGAVDPAELAEALRKLRIGWGRARSDAARATLGNDAPVPAALGVLLDRLLASLPPVPELGTGSEPRVAPQDIARALLDFLTLVPETDESDRFNAKRLRGRLQQLADAEEGSRPFGAALAEVREALGDFRVWTQVAPDVPPRLSHGGAVHLSDLRHAGTSGRRRIFVLGLDADRVAGPRVSDPLLPDAVRQELPELGTVAARRAEARWLVGRAIAGLTGRVTLSYAVESEHSGETGPAPVLLDIARELWNAPALDYPGLRERLGVPACAVPSVPERVLDERDAWLRAIGAGDTLLDATEAVRAHFPALDAGLAAVEWLDAESVNSHHGLVPAAAGRFDPTGSGAAPVSPTSLELLSKCPLAWFYRYALGVEPLQDPEYDPDLWLDSMARGSLLHLLFEEFVRHYRGRQEEILDRAADAELLAICDRILVAQRAVTPPPSETVFQAEREEILRAATSFLAMERELLGKPGSPRWEDAELWVSGAGAVVTLPGGRTLQLKGKIDRVDRLPKGARLILDFKTGSPWPFRKVSKKGPLHGGRLLQPALYTAAYAALHDASVGRFEYRFPTARGRNQIIHHNPAELEQGLAIVPGVIQPLASGAFLPTTDVEDCKYCNYRDICRVQGGEEGIEKPDSPRATWAASMAEDSPLYAPMVARRTPA